jgi:RNA polymerase sigma factor (sigma-70 family)
MSRKIAATSVWKANDTSFDERYFVSLYKDFHTELISYGIKICRDEDIVLDSIHEVFLDLWENKMKFGQIRDLKPYILRSLRNQIINCIRIQSRYNHTNNSDFPSHITFSISQEELMIRDENQEINAKKVQDLLSSLTDHQREVIFLKYFSGLSDKQIAEVTGMKHQSVRNHLSKSLKKLKEVSSTCLVFILINML